MESERDGWRVRETERERRMESEGGGCGGLRNLLKP